MQHKLLATPVLEIIKLTLGALLLSIGLFARAACDGAGDTCSSNEAPAVQQSSAAPDTGVGNPINVITGNKYQKEVDLPALPGILGLEIVRHYNSSLSGRRAVPGPVGRGWRLSYETELTTAGNTIEIKQADGSSLAFGRDLVNPRTARHRNNERGTIAITHGPKGDEYLWTWNDGRKLSFNHQGKLVQIQAPTGEILSMQHDGRGFLVRVTDPQGRSLQLSWLDKESARGTNRFRGVQSINTPVGRFSYGYGSTPPKGAVTDPIGLLANLVAVRYPATGDITRGRRYHYEDGLHPTLLTGISHEGQDGPGKLRTVRFASYAYRGDGRAIMSTHAGEANKVTLDFSTPNQTTLTNSIGQKTVYRHEVIGDDFRLLEVRGAGCATCGETNLRYNYDKLGKLTESIRLDSVGVPLSATKIIADSHGRPARILNVAYSAAGKPRAPQLIVRYEYGPGKDPILIARPSVIPGKEAISTLRYNAAGQLLAITESGWTPALKPGSESQPINQTSTFTYRQINARSVLVRIDGPRKNGSTNSPVDSDVTDLEYDAGANLVNKNNASADMVQQVVTRDEALRPTSIRNSDGVRMVETRLTYDHAGRPLTVEKRASFVAAPMQHEPLTRKMAFSYDVSGALSTVTTPDRTTLRAEYDEAGRPVSLTDPKGNRVTTRFDSEGRVVAVLTQDAKGTVLNGMMNLWSEQNSLVAVLDTNGISTAHAATQNRGETIRVNANGYASVASTDGLTIDVLEADDSVRRIALVRGGMLYMNGAHQVQAFGRDDFDRQVFEMTPHEGRLRYRYADGWFEKTQVGNDGVSTSVERLEFSGAGRLTKRTLAGCTETIQYEGNLVSALIGCGSAHRYVRDAFGQILKDTLMVSKPGGGTVHLNTSYRYDTITGQLLERRLPDAQRLAYRYDTIDGKPTAVSRDVGWLAWADRHLGHGLAGVLREALPSTLTSEDIFSATWRPFGGVDTISSSNGVIRATQVDQNGRTVAIDIGKVTGPAIERLRYRHDGENNVIASSRNWKQTIYHYDAMNRLRSETPGPVPHEILAGGTESDVERLGRHQFTPSGNRRDSTGRTVQDAFGRQQARGIQRFQYDSANRLVAVQEYGKVIARYRYDSLGNRVSKTVAGDTTFYLYDSAHQLLAEADEGGRVTTQYLYADRKPVAVMQAERSQQTRALYAVHTDERGLPLSVTDENVALVWQADFDAFGNRRSPQFYPKKSTPPWGLQLISSDVEEGDGFVMNLRLAGQYADLETGLYYNVHRYYDPAGGRYTTPDPIGLAGSVNAHAYMDGNPMNGTDPLGLFAVPASAFLGNDSIFLKRQLPLSDGGHGDIIRIAFAQYAREAQTNRFSQEIIDQIVMNNYHSDANGIGCLTYIVNGAIAGGGQCSTKNHFDNPNHGAMYSSMPDPTNPNKKMVKLPSYADNEDDNWIADAAKQLKKNRGNYGTLVQVRNAVSISGLLNAFGQNTHAIADFYSHSNWTDSSSYTSKIVNGEKIYDYERGGKVRTYHLDVGTKKIYSICNWVPSGLNRSVIWDESSDIDKLFSGSAHSAFETKYSDKAYSHSYWNKDSETATGGQAEFLKNDGSTDTELLRQFSKEGKYFWQVQVYDPAKSPDLKNKTLGYGTAWYGEDLKSKIQLKKGDRIFVRTPISNHHHMAFYLAIEHTKNDIRRLFKAAPTTTFTKGASMAETVTLQDVFRMNKAQLEWHSIHYTELYDKANGAVSFP